MIASRAWRRTRAAIARLVGAAREHVGIDVALELLLREALRRCIKSSG